MGFFDLSWEPLHIWEEFSSKLKREPVTNVPRPRLMALPCGSDNQPVESVRPRCGRGQNARGHRTIMPSIAIHGYSALQSPKLQIRLVDHIVDSKGWVLEEKQVSSVAYQIRFEVEMDNVVEMYSALQHAGVQFPRTSQRTFTEMCLCNKFSSDPDLMQILTITLRVGTLHEENLRFRKFLRSNAA